MHRLPGVSSAAAWLRAVCLAALSVLGFLWLIDAPIRLRLPLIDEYLYLAIAGLSTAAGFLTRRSGGRAAWLDVPAALGAIALWGWAAWRYEEWLILGGHQHPEKWLTGAAALVLLFEAIRRCCGGGIAAMMGLIALYAFTAHWFPGVLEGQYTEPRRLIAYLYVDTNGVPGIVLAVASTVVLAFIIFSKCLEATGAGRFFDGVSLAILGHYRGGPAKVAVASSSLFGIISGSSVANVVSSGIVTIPLMKRAGFSPSYAGAVEAVSSNAGQITPPVMGATAFIIAEFLQIPYSEVVLAAAVPAAVFYVVLLVQIDAYAARHRLQGLPRAELPSFWSVFANGWIYVLPIALLVYLMFWQGMNVGKAALYSAGSMLLLSFLKNRVLALKPLLRSLTIGVGEDMLTILLVSAGAGVVIGALNISGLSFSITLLLTQAAQNWGVLAMLVLTAVLAIVLGMGIPTSAVYVLLSVILAPALVKMGMVPLAAHMFIFYFGLMSMLTPPVAMASYAAAGIANAGLWQTSWSGIRLGASGYLLPFVFALNPALLWKGTPLAIFYACTTVLLSGAMLGWAVESSIGARQVGAVARIALFAGALGVGGATILVGVESPLNVAFLAAGVALCAALRISPHKASRVRA
ncbi:MAG TPA: TRAP transporter fused permease subunit [Burkholderiales bacterium]|nr:TRAP transporter fused permease subunit [Burkholderiales bacterium]